MIRTLCVATITVVVAGCGSPDGPSRAGATRENYAVRGVVRKVDPASRSVTISHEEIPGFMAKMTMPFTVIDPSLLDDIQPGDEVIGTLRVTSKGGESKDFTLVELAVTKPATSPPPVPDVAEGPSTRRLTTGELVPDFAVTTQDGSTLRLSDLKGNVVVLTFVYTRCPMPEFCPAIDAKFADLARRVSAVPARSDRVRLLSVSFDPEHDTPEILAAHARLRGARPPLWTFAVASHAELDKVAGPLGLTYVPGTREIDHNLRTAVIDADGRLARLELGAGWAPADLAREVSRLSKANQD